MIGSVPGEYGIIVRTNSREASKEDFFRGALPALKSRYENVAVHGRNRTCFSLLYEAEPFYLAAIRNTYTSDLDGIVRQMPLNITR